MSIKYNAIAACIAEDRLHHDQALATDCEDIKKRLGLTERLFEGFVVIESTASLDVTGVYSAIEVDPMGRVGSANSIDVERVHERKHLGGQRAVSGSK